MRKPNDPKDLAVDLLRRSQCSVKVSAVLADAVGIVSWGRNHSGSDGMGCHAEVDCLRRANPKRIPGATLYVAAIRARNSKTITAQPCADCQRRIQRCQRVLWRDASGNWRALW